MIYIVIAYRWNQYNNHSYLVGCNKKKQKAIEIAEKEVNYRGGKYSCWVYECKEDYEWNEETDNKNIIYKAKGLELEL